MKKLLLAITLLTLFSGLKAQCYPAFKTLNVKTPYFNSECSDRNFPYLYRYTILPYKNSDSSYLNFGYFDGSSWTSLNGHVISGYSYRLLKWGNKIITSGKFYRVGQLKAPANKYFGALEYKSGKWDTIPGCTFDSTQYVEFCASSTDMFMRIPNSTNNGGSVYQYDNGAKSFTKIVDYQTYNYLSTTLMAGTNRVVLSNVYSVNGNPTNGFAYFENNSINLCHSSYFHADERYCIDKATDDIYSMYYANNPVVNRFTNAAQTPRKTHLSMVGAYNPLHVYNGQLILMSYGDDTRDNFYNILCVGDTIWKTIQNLKFSGSVMTNPYCAVNGTYCERFDNITSFLLKLENGSLLSGQAFIDKDTNCNLDSADIWLKKYMVFAKGPSFFSSTQTDDSGHFELFVGSDTLKVYGAGKLTTCAGQNSIITQSGNTYAKNIPIKDPGAYDVKVKINSEAIIRWNDIGLYAMEIENNGYPADTVNLTFDSDPKVRIHFTDNNFTTKTNTRASGQLFNLDYYEKRWVYVSAWIDTAQTKPDSVLCHTISAGIRQTESDYSNNSDKTCQRVVYSYDPNHKSCNVKKAKPDVVTKLDYTIEFQNEGSADAIDVVVVDALSNKLNGKTFKITGSSHPYTVQYGEGQITFTFKNIHLTPKSVDEGSSKGFINYSIETVSGLQNGDSVMNNAYIYFDLNTPVITNWCAVHISDNLTDINQVQTTSGKFSLYPNPASQAIQIISNENHPVYVYNTMGQLVAEATLRDGFATVDLSALPAGIYIVRCGNQVGRFIKQD